MTSHRLVMAAVLVSISGCDLQSLEVAFEMQAERFSPADGAFSTLTPPHIERNLFSVVATDSEVLVFGGVDESGSYIREVEAYDPTGDQWSSRARWDDPGLAWVLPVGNLICMFGGFDTVDQPIRRDIDCYDPIADTWTAGTAVPDAYSTMYPAVLNGRIYLLGGTEVQSGNIVAPVDWARVYDPVSAAWSELAPLPAARGLMGVEPLGGRLYLIGGYNAANFDASNDSPEEREMLVYDPTADSWTVAPQMPTSRALFGTDVVADRLVVFFGITDGPLVEVFDPAASQWSANPDPEDELADGVYSYVQHQGLMYFLVLADGVSGSGTSASGKLWSHDARTGQWTVPGTRDPEQRDALFLGAGLGADIYWVGAFTEITAELAPAGHAPRRARVRLDRDLPWR